LLVYIHIVRHQFFLFANKYMLNVSANSVLLSVYIY
jgi:hypothetical protein